MKLEKALSILKEVPHMTPDQGSLIYKLILDNEIENILELGTAHGTSSCYMAAALEERKLGSVTTIDNKSALNRSPNINELVEKCNLQEYITPIIANKTYNWELMKLIEQQSIDGVCEPLFDFCYLDGAHNFEVDCCAFFLVDKLLKPNGIIIFDDLNWTYARSKSLKDSELVKEMSKEVKTTPHIKKIVDLIVFQHPNYYQPDVKDEWCLVRKKGNSNKISKDEIKLDLYSVESSISDDFKKLLKKIKSKL